MARLTDLTVNQNAFLDMLGFSEGTSTIPESDDGYNVIVGGTLFDSYANHPHQLVHLNANLSSTAAGRYQLLARYYDFYSRQMHLTDFSPETQDILAMTQIKECHALSDIANGDFASAVNKCSHIWASLPGANYPGQHMQTMADLTKVYIEAGGTLA